MKVDFEFNSALAEIESEITKLPYMVKQEEKNLFKKIANVVKKNVIKHLPKSDRNIDKNFDKSQPYVHMKDDVKTSVREKDGNIFAVVFGGKKTAFKWHLVNDGARGKDGKLRTQATHFVEKALKDSDSEISALVDEVIKKVVE